MIMQLVIDVIGIFVIYKVFGLCDSLLHKSFVNLSSNSVESSKTPENSQVVSNNDRWISLHIIANTFITLLCITDVIKTLHNPIDCILGGVTKIPSYIAVAVHLYHACNFQDLSLSDWMHHTFSAFLCGSIAIAIEWGPILNYILFFITGMPGGINYILLLLCKYGYISKLRQKYINSHLNMWIRAPGLVSSVCFAYASWYVYSDSIDIVKCFTIALVCAINLLNGLYYNYDVCVNYGEYKNKMAQNIKTQEMV